MTHSIRRLKPAILAAAAAAMFSAAAHAGGPGAALTAGAAPAPVRQMIVKFRTGAAPSAAMREVAQSHGVTMAKLRDMALGAQVFKLDRALAMPEARRLAQALRGVAGVEFADADQVLTADFVPNDPLYSSAPQWHYYDPAAGINLEKALEKAQGWNTVVAVLDTGFRPHADLAANLIEGYDFIVDTDVSNDGDGRDADASDPGDWYKLLGIFPIDSSWHGTHVAGTIAAVTNNGIGVAGVAPRAKVMPVRVLGQGGGYTSDISDAIVWASGGTVPGVPKTKTPAQVINMSLGGTGACSEIMQRAITSAGDRGTLTVTSAGNDGFDAIKKNPANCKNAFPVAALGREGGKASYSNFGAIVKLAAPGGDKDEYVWSTLNTGKKQPGEDAYAGYQGTSMASPHAAAVAALVFSKNPALKPKQVAKILVRSTRPFADTCDQCGSGALDANRALGATPAP
jgi:serine protease